ncbi:carbonic anhydrase, partial [Aliarcobacter butzleri]|nr:carbonic anhydrase [Aliarcobacter butzleri]
TLLAIQDKSDEENLYRTTEKISIVYQMENLLTFPYIEERIKNGELQIHGWYYKIEDGSIEYYDGEECSFKPLSE